MTWKTNTARSFIFSLLALFALLPHASALAFQVRQQADPVRPTVGLPFRLTVIVEGENATNFEPDENYLRDKQTTWIRTLKKFLVETQGKSLRLKLELVGTVAGRQPLPPLTLRTKQGMAREIQLEPIDLQSNLRPEDQTTVPFALKLAEPPDTLVSPPVRKVVPYGLGLLGVFAAALLLFWLWRWRQSRKKAVEEPLPPDLAALQELERLETEGLIAKRQFKEFYTRLSETVRVFLGTVFGFDGLECTSSELVRELEDKPIPPSVERDIFSLLEEADLVKFAKYRPEPSAAERALERARTVVRSIPITQPSDTQAGLEGGPQ
ncbi:MAG: hypothetical protein ACPL7D_08985 [Candidatus Sumerlaeaceae bacterium]|jgi:hypothetical protein